MRRFDVVVPNSHRVVRRPEDDLAADAEAAREAQPPAPVADLLRLQQSAGNAYVSRLVGEATVARRKHPDAAESVGAEPDQVSFMPGAPGEANEVLAVGDKGYTLQMLKEVPKAAGKTFGNYAGAHLKPVVLTTKFLDEKTLPYLAEKWREASEKGEYTPYWSGAPSAHKIWQKQAAEHQAQMTQLADDKVKEQQLTTDYNAGVPRANQTFVSLAKLEAMQDMLGVKDPKSMSDAVVKSLQEAQELGERTQVKKGIGSLKAPEAAAQVTEAGKQVTQAQKELSTGWLGVQQLLLMDHVAAIKKKGEPDETRLKQINDTVTLARRAGAMIDLSMAVVSGGAAMTEGGGGKATPSQMMDLMGAEKPDFSDKTSLEGAKKVGGAITKSMGIEIPTSASGILETAAKIYYFSEMEGIRKRLVELNALADIHTQAGSDIDAQSKVKHFSDKLGDFKAKAEFLQKAQLDRQLAYLALGEQLDAAARSDPKAAAGAPGVGKERFATVMIITAGVREVLAMAEGAKSGFGGTASARKLEVWDIIQHRSPYKWPEEEDKALGSMLSQQQMFEDNVDELTKTLGPIDEQAGKMMTALSAGSADAAAY